MPGRENDLWAETGGGYDAGGYIKGGLPGVSGRRRRMKIKLIDFGAPKNRRPFRPHGNDAGADVYMPYDCTLQPGEIAKVPLGFGLEVPDGYAGFVFPRTSMAVKGLVCELPPVDSGYRGEIHAIISNVSSKPQELSKGTRVGQLVITPVEQNRCAMACQGYA
uniref:dUTP diphosphatase n=1 Tax=Enterocloster clostridioformis TaxID=1531 RepID=UPI003FA425B6